MVVNPSDRVIIATAMTAVAIFFLQTAENHKNIDKVVINRTGNKT
ncbi:hypothetical protein CJA_2470 [Cellvibrio japonicus Ueda107]|uniref:Uncharacterized protein n=1 Tax=Cellvibrio japonicus (strain Ueda107) TaxID=498211 RepID=B3PKK2_CELJU|nr:hypothetical protein CJA_2470 [Cellvibrio japonicus Ueda107]